MRNRILLIILTALIAASIHGCGKTKAPVVEGPAPTVMDLKEIPAWDAMDFSGYEFKPVIDPGEGRLTHGLYYIPEVTPIAETAELWRIDLETYAEEKILDLPATTGAIHDYTIGPTGRFIYILQRPRNKNVDMQDMIRATRGKNEGEKNEILKELFLFGDECTLMVYDVTASDYVRCERDGTVVDGIPLSELPDFGLWPRHMHIRDLVLPCWKGFNKASGFKFRQFITLDLVNLSVSDIIAPFPERESLPALIKVELARPEFNITKATFFTFMSGSNRCFQRVLDTSTGLYESETQLDWPDETGAIQFAQNDLSPLICAYTVKEIDGKPQSMVETAWDKNVYTITDYYDIGSEKFRGAFFINQTAFVIPVDKSTDSADLRVVRMDINSGEVRTFYAYTGGKGEMSPLDFTADLKAGLFAGGFRGLSDGNESIVNRLFIYNVASDEILKTFESETAYTTPRFFIRK